MSNLIRHLKNKELFLALYFLTFILGVSLGVSYNFYNEARVLEVLLLLGFGFYSVFSKEIFFSKKEYLFLVVFISYLFFLKNSQFIIFDILLFYLLYKSFFILNYNLVVSKIIVLSSFLIFMTFPLSLLGYWGDGVYRNWYPMPWNIRVYNSYFLILLIFSTWLLMRGNRYTWVYLLFTYLSLLSILLDGGRSALLAYSTFFIIVIIFNKKVRLKLIFIYIISWLSFLLIVFSAGIASDGISIARVTTSRRSDLWVHALQCWIESPIFGCGFYQLGAYENLSAHPHNLFIQILTETGVMGFSFLALIIFGVLRNISWNIKENYFVIAAFFAIGVDLSFSGIHIYPITQVGLLWLFVFLLKNPEFRHAKYFSDILVQNPKSVWVVNFIIYLIITCAFIYLFVNTSALSESLAVTPPRFWEYGYQLF
ncbi:O-antigen ligase family protein [Acinetobacter johnsonii]|uniref:O-antigen ligase family protein n=1 Tax=Acinetobacter johnsonii TaxID=40214 RepID=UPI00301B1619